jgi:hypothetical protein
MTDKRPIYESENGVNRMKCVKNSVTVMYGVDALQQADRYEDSETGESVLVGFGDKYRPEGDTRMDRIKAAVERADVIPERVQDTLDSMGISY